MILRQEYIEGKPLDALLRAGKKVALQPPLTQVVQELHAQGMVHNDVRPSNVIVNKKWQPVLIDFTSAHLFTTRYSKLFRLLRYHDIRHSLKIKHRMFGNLSKRERSLLHKSKWVEVPHGFWRNRILPLLKRW